MCSAGLEREDIPDVQFKVKTIERSAFNDAAEYRGAIMRDAKTFIRSISVALSGLISLGTLMPAASIAAVEGASSLPAAIVARTWEHRKATIK